MGIIHQFGRCAPGFQGRLPAGHRVAGLAAVARGDVGRVLAGGAAAIVAADAVVDDARVVEPGRCPGGGGMAVAALGRRRDVRRRLAGGDGAVVARGAAAGEGGVVERRRVPGNGAVAEVALRAGRHVPRRLAGRRRIVVTTRAAAKCLLVVEAAGRPPLDGRVAGTAVLGAHDVGGSLRRGADARAGRVAGKTLARRALEDRVQVTGFAGLPPMGPGQLVTRGEVIEATAGTLGEHRSAEQREQQESAGEENLHDGLALLQAGALERRGAMAALALAPELPEVDVVLRVAGGAIARQLHHLRRLFVAALAGGARVSAKQRKFGGLGVIEFPDTPTVR